MKKLLYLLFYFFPLTAPALPVETPVNFPEEPCDECSFFHRYCSVGFYGDYVFNRHLETVEGKDIDTTSLFTNAGYIALNFFDRFSLFSTLGVSRLAVNTSLGAFNAVDPHPLFEIETQSAFSFSIGGKGTLYKYKKSSLGITGQYFFTNPRIKRLYIASGAVSYPDDVLRTRYSEWQIGAGISYLYSKCVVPYGAVKYAHSFWKLNNGKRFIIEDNTGTFLFNLRNQKCFGYVLGVSFCPTLCECFNIIAEVRFLDELACHINVQMLF